MAFLQVIKYYYSTWLIEDHIYICKSYYALHAILEQQFRLDLKSRVTLFCKKVFRIQGAGIFPIP